MCIRTLVQPRLRRRHPLSELVHTHLHVVWLGDASRAHLIPVSSVELAKGDQEERR